MKVKFGAGIVDARGSIAGMCYSRNRYSAYARARVVPVNPNTARQQTVRGIMTEIVNYWSETLTAAQRLAWETYAAAIPWTNALGETQYLTGFNMFIRSAMAIQRVGGTIVDDGPSTLLLPATDDTLSVAGDIPNQELDVSFDDTKEWLDEDGGYLSVKIGQPINGTRNYFNGPWRYAGVVEGDSTTPPTSPAAIAAPWTIAAGQKVFVEARIIRADGRVSVPFRASVLLS